MWTQKLRGNCSHPIRGTLTDQHEMLKDGPKNIEYKHDCGRGRQSEI